MHTLITDRRPLGPSLSAAGAKSRLKVLVLYDDRAVHTNTVRDHLASFVKYSRHDVFYAVATSDAPCEMDLAVFDVVIVHYTVRVCVRGHISPPYAEQLKRFGGLKIQFIQDEYDTTEVARQFFEDAGINVVFTILDPAAAEIVYPRWRFPEVKFVQTLTGYVPPELEAAFTPKPLARRKNWLVYRARELAYWYGNLGREKIDIGRKMRGACLARDIPCDISWHEKDRIYGPAWAEFLQNARATLGTPSGSTVFDYHGELRRSIETALAEDPTVSYEEIFQHYLAQHEGQVALDVLSPKIFEAIACRTALVLFPGAYNGAVEPERHYIELARDFSNVDEVLAKVGDDRYLEALTARAYDDVIGSGRYSYRRFVSDVDELISSLVPEANPIELQVGVIGVVAPGQKPLDIIPQRQAGYLPSKTLCERLSRVAPPPVIVEVPAPPPPPPPPTRLRRIARRLPGFVKRPLHRIGGMLS
jgi:hypothetical protein